MTFSGFVLEILNRALWITSALLPTMLPIIELLIQSSAAITSFQITKGFFRQLVFNVDVTLHKQVYCIYMNCHCCLTFSHYLLSKNSWNRGWEIFISGHDPRHTCKNHSGEERMHLHTQIIIIQVVCRLYGTGYRINCLGVISLSHTETT